jgi:excisionase family DNA binding protein
VSNFQTIQYADKTRALETTDTDYFTVQTAARHLTVSARTLFRLIAEKKLKKKKLRRRTVILKEDIKIFFAQQ